MNDGLTESGGRRLGTVWKYPAEPVQAFLLCFLNTAGDINRKERSMYKVKMNLWI